MNESDCENYYEYYSKFMNDIPKPDVIIFLRTSPAVLLERIKARGRDYEQDIQLDYLEIINQCYEEYITLMKQEFGVRVIVIETNKQTILQVGNNVSEAIKNVAVESPSLLIV